MPAVSNYLDLDLLVEREGEGYQARVLSSPGGQATSTFRSPFSSLELENFLLKVGMSLSEIRRNVRRIDSSDMAEIKSFGACNPLSSAASTKLGGGRPGFASDCGSPTRPS